MRDIAIYTLAVAVIAAGAVPAAWGSAQLDIYINPASPESGFAVTYQMTVIIFYEEGGNLAALPARDGQFNRAGRARTGIPASRRSRGRLRPACWPRTALPGSGALTLTTARPSRGASPSATVSHTVRVNGTLQGHTIVPGSANQPAIVGHGMERHHREGSRRPAGDRDQPAHQCH